MKKIVIFLLFVLFPLNVEAYYCDYEDYNNMQKKALNVNIMTDYEIIDDNATFTVTIYNLDESHYIIDTKNSKTYNYNGTDSLKIIITNPGVYSFEVYSTDNYCDDTYLYKLFAEIPTYNKYYKDDLCKGIESYKYCQRWFSSKITYEEFKRGVNEYKNSFKEEKIEEEIPYKSIYEYILEFYLDYWYIILPIVIVIGISGIVIKLRQENKFNL